MKQLFFVKFCRDKYGVYSDVVLFFSNMFIFIILAQH